MRYPGVAGGGIGGMSQDDEIRRQEKERKRQEDYQLKMGIGQSLLSTIPVLGGLLGGIAGGVGSQVTKDDSKPSTPPPNAPATPEGAASYTGLEDLYPLRQYPKDPRQQQRYPNYPLSRRYLR